MELKYGSMQVATQVACELAGLEFTSWNTGKTVYRYMRISVYHVGYSIFSFMMEGLDEAFARAPRSTEI